MSSQIRAIVDAVRVVAADELGVRLPLAKMRNAISQVLYGRPYSAALAAEKAGTPPPLNPTAERAAAAGEEFAVSGDSLWTAVSSVLSFEDDEDLEHEDDEDGEYDDDAVLEGLAVILRRIETAVARGEVAWADFHDTDDLLDRFGNEHLRELAEWREDVYAVLDNGITSDGRSIIEDVRGLSSQIGSLPALDAVVADAEKRIKSLGKKPPATRRANITVLTLLVSWDESKHSPRQPPYVDYDRVNFEPLIDAIADCCAVPNSCVRIANDVLDQVTPYMRMRRGGQRLDCGDFGEAVWDAASEQASRVIDVRKRFEPLHEMKNRRHAPPPIAIYFTVETKDFTDSSQLIQNVRLSLGITAGTMMEAFEEGPVTTEGRLPGTLKLAFERVFGVPFNEPAMIGMVVNKDMPEWVTRALESEGYRASGR